MAYEQKTLLALTSNLVKSGLVIAATTVMAASAQADDVVTFKFTMSEVDNETGVADVYKRMSRLAKTECRKGASPILSNASIKWCAEDLLEQLVESADVPVLTHYHKSKSGPKSTFLAGLL